jgi:pimeloyl-ACP methyl ester carboxylesterase
MATFVRVPGGWHGGWDFCPLTDRLRARGHVVHELTLSGVGERNHFPAGAVNLDTHIDDVVRVFEQEDVNNAVLCGHSYGGMVIAGVADRIRRSLVGALAGIGARLVGCAASPEATSPR